MINKKKLWFLTLFSIILVLSIYYVTMPEELMFVSSENNEKVEELKVDTEVNESDILVALRIEADKQMQEEMDDLKLVLTDVNSSIDEKNKAIENIKELNNRRSEEEGLEEKIKKDLSLKAFVKIDGLQVRVVVLSKEHDAKIANKIMRLVQSSFEKKVTVSVKFQTS